MSQATIGDMVDETCEVCGSTDGVTAGVTIPVPCDTAIVSMCMSCRTDLAKGRTDFLINRIIAEE